jgi:hypothetical protein
MDSACRKMKSEPRELNAERLVQCVMMKASEHSSLASVFLRKGVRRLIAA